MRRHVIAELSGSLAIPRPRRSDEDGTGHTPNLTERDLELIRHLAQGRSTHQIAAAMSITSNTTRTRIRRVQRKLAADHRQDVVAAARRQLGAV